MGQYGIDSDFLELVEWRSQIAAFVETPCEKQPFGRYEFFSRRFSGANYAVFSLLGRLVSRDSRDNSLSKAWNLAIPYLRSGALTAGEEVSELDKLMDPSRGRFTNRESPALRFRNKAIAHNEATPRIEWESVDADIQVLARVWAILTVWSEGPVLFPFRDSQQVFLGLESAYSAAEVAHLCQRRDEYLARAKEWCRTNIVTNEVDAGRSPFATMSVSMTLQGSR